MFLILRIISSRRSLWNLEMKQKICTMKCTALKVLEVVSFSLCNEDVIQKCSFMW